MTRFLFPFDYGSAGPVTPPPPPPPPAITPTLTYAFPVDGDALPAGGYLLPLFPRGWFRDAPNARALFGVLDQHLDQQRQSLDALHDAHLWPTATGQDQDDLAALVGVPRLPGESDDDYARRAPATAQHLSASTIPDMTAYLGGALGLPVVIQDGITPGTFTVTVIGTPARPSSVLPLIRGVKAAGTEPSAQIRILNATEAPGTGRVGTFRVGDEPVGGAGLFIQLQ